MPRGVRSTRRIEIGPDVGAVLRPEEVERLHELRDLESLRCFVCGEWMAPGSSDAASVSIASEAGVVIAQFAHHECADSSADLAELVVMADAEPLGIAYTQALHPEAGAVLLWERKLDIRVRGLARGDLPLYLDAGWWNGFHEALPDEPVRLLSGWTLDTDGEDLVLTRDGAVVERFHAAAEDRSGRWFDALHESGFCLLLVGARLELGHPGAAPIQRAIRVGHALMGLVEFQPD